MPGRPLLHSHSHSRQNHGRKTGLAGGERRGVGTDLEVDEVVLCQQDAQVAGQGHVAHAAATAAVYRLAQVLGGGVSAGSLNEHNKW